MTRIAQVSRCKAAACFCSYFHTSCHGNRVFASLVSFLVLTFFCSFVPSLPIVTWFQLFPFSLVSFWFILSFFMLSSCFFHFCCWPCPPRFNHSPKPTHGRITWWVPAKRRRRGGQSVSCLCRWSGDKKGFQKGVQKKERFQIPAESGAEKVSESAQCTEVCCRGHRAPRSLSTLGSLHPCGTGRPAAAPAFGSDTLLGVGWDWGTHVP